MMKPEASKIISNKKISEGHYILRLHSAKIASKAQPGQFVQILVNAFHEPLLPRPFTFLDVHGPELEILYQVVGQGTAILAEKKEDEVLWILGPLGNGWQVNDESRSRRRRMLLVGGGVGIPPLYHLAKAMVEEQGAKFQENIKVFLGGRTKAFLHCHKEFQDLGVEVFVATDDGSEGHYGLVTEILEKYIQKEKEAVPVTREIYTCGPTPMLKAVSDLSFKNNLDCQVSVEEPMPCGFGVCLGCAIKVKTKDGNFRYALSCTEGPVFDGQVVDWT